MMVIMMQKALSSYVNRINALIHEKVNSVKHSINTLKLQGQTEEQLYPDLQDDVNNHKNTINPHRLLPDTLGSYSKDEVNNLINTRVRGSLLPISRYGQLSEDPIHFTRSGTVITIHEVGAVIIHGRIGELSPFSFNLTTLDVSTPVYIYIEILNNETQYILSNTRYNESSKLLVGSITANGSDYTVDIVKTTMYAGARFSKLPQANSVPVTSGKPMVSESLDPSWFD